MLPTINGFLIGIAIRYEMGGVENKKQ